MLNHIGHHTASDKAIVNSENLIFKLEILRIWSATGPNGAIRVANLMYYCNPIAVSIKVAKDLAASTIREVVLSRILS